LLPAADHIAANGRRLCYSQSPTRLDNDAVAATKGRPLCYTWSLALLPMLSAAATHAAGAARQWPPALLRKAIDAATHGRWHCYTRLPYLLQTPASPAGAHCCEPPPTLAVVTAACKLRFACCCKRRRLQQGDRVGATSDASVDSGHGSLRSSAGLRWGEEKG
jgi:hypothetical protein